MGRGHQPSGGGPSVACLASEKHELLDPSGFTGSPGEHWWWSCLPLTHTAILLVPISVAPGLQSPAWAREDAHL